jgi:two-component system cell cycle sensor histidine kinase/response regulator CckA
VYFLKYYIFLLFILIPLGVCAQHYNVHQFNVEKGIPRGFYRDITQDSLGAVWLASDFGVVKFDGVHQIIESEQNPDLPATIYDAIFCDNKNNIWTVTSRPSIEIYVGSQSNWQKKKSPGQVFDNNIVQAIAAVISPADTLAIAVSRYGFVGSYRNQQWISLGRCEGNFAALTATNTEIYYSIGSNLYRATPGKTDQHLYQHSKNIRALTTDPAGRIWIISVGEAGYFQSGKYFQVQEFPDSPKARNTDLIIDGAGGIIWGDNYNIYHYNNRKYPKLSKLGLASGLHCSGVSSMLHDFEHNLWFVDPRGISQMDPMRFANFSKENNLLTDEVSAIAEFSDGKVLLGHNIGITLFDPIKSIGIPMTVESDPENNVARILDFWRDGDDFIWAAISSAGLARISRNGSVRYYNSQQINSEYISSVLGGEDGSLLLGTMNGLIHFNGTTFYRDSAITTRIRKLFRDRDGTLFIAVLPEGFARIQDGKVVPYKSNVSHKRDQFFSFVHRADGTRLVGGHYGLFVAKGDSLSLYEINGQTITEPVYLLMEDPMKGLWIGTHNGIYYSDHRMLHYFNKTNGFGGYEINRSAGLVAGNGLVYFGSESGLSVYQPLFDYDSLAAPHVSIHEIESNLGLIDVGKEKELEYHHDDLLFRFHAISNIDSKKIHYRVELEGLEKGWIYTDQPEIRFTNLGPGTYQLKVQARNTLSGWGPSAISYPITIKAPLWRRTPVQILAAALSLLVIFSVVFLIRRAYLSKLLESEVEHRTAELLKSEERYRTLFENTKEAIYISTYDGQVLDINKAGVHLFGFNTIGEFMQNNQSTNYYQDIADRSRLLKLLDNDGHVYNHEMHMKKADGTPIILNGNISTFRDNYGRLLIFGILSDNTEIRRLESQLYNAQKLESIGLLAGGIAHDFNNILGAIIGYASHLSEFQEDEKFREEGLEAIQRSAQRGAELVKRLLTFAKGGEFNLRVLHINPLLTETISIVQSTFDRSISIVTNFNPELPTVRVDSSQMQQVFLNLFVNARDAMSEGGTLTITTDLVERAVGTPVVIRNTFVRIQVSDTGIGIEPDKLKNIYDPFYTTKQPSQGTGLGLAMVYGVIQKHNGVIEVNSNVGKGTVFEILLPVDGAAVESESAEKINLEKGNGNVLVVDDEEVLRNLLRTILTRQDYNVDLAPDGIEALKRYNDPGNHYKIVILDMVMPKMGGYECYQTIRKKNPDQKVIITSGYSDKIERGDISKNKYTRVVSKPFNRSKILSVVQELIAVD